MGRTDPEGPSPGLLNAELSVLYEISSALTFGKSEGRVIREALDKASRMFPVRALAVWIGSNEQGHLAAAWGGCDANDVRAWLREDAATRFRFSFGDDLNPTVLLMEQSGAVTGRERRLYTLFAKRLRSAVLMTRNIIAREQAESRQKVMAEGLRAVVDIADQLILCADSDRLLRRAVELARERLGLERCSIFLRKEGGVQGTYGTDIEGRTIDERTHSFEEDEEWTRRFRPLGPEDPRWWVEETERTYWSNNTHIDVGPGWIVSTPIIRVGQQPIAVFFNDSAITNAPFDPVQQEVVAVFCSFLGDIFERKLAEEQLQLAEAKYRALVEQLPAIIYTVRLAGEPRTTYISPQVETLLGFTQKEWIANPALWIDQLHPEDREGTIATIHEHDSKGEPFLLEYRVLARDGRILWFRNQGVYLSSESGTPEMVHGVMSDITARKHIEQELERHKEHLEELVRERTSEVQERNVQLRREVVERGRAEEALRESESKYRTLFEASTDAIFIETPDGHILDCNPAACEMLGYNKEELVHLRVADLVPDDVAETLSDVVEQKPASGRLFVEAKNRKKSGEEVPVEVSARLVVLGGEQVVVAFVREITERKQAEEERCLMVERVAEAKERELFERTNRLTSVGLLAAGVAHEVNNPLQGMLSHLKAVKSAVGDDFAKRDSLLMVEQGMQTIASLVRKLLAFSREPQKRTESALSSEAIDFVMQLIDAQFRDAGITIVRKEQHPALRLDLSQRDLVQVLLNLFINASDAMSGGGQLTVTSKREGDECHIMLSDTGKGIPKKMLGQIFSPFFTTKGMKGTGLGLSVAESLVRHCEGRIEVESEPGKGSRFHVYIPLARGKKS